MVRGKRSSLAPLRLIRDLPSELQKTLSPVTISSDYVRIWQMTIQILGLSSSEYQVKYKKRILNVNNNLARLN